MISAASRLKLPAAVIAVLLLTASTVPASHLTVVSLNLAGESSADRVLDEIKEVAAIRDADVFLLQEVVRPDISGRAVSEELAARMGYHSIFAPAFRLRPDTVEGIAILSRFPLRDTETLQLKNCNVRFRTRSRIALGSTIVTPAGSIRVFNAHLDNRINVPDRLDQLSPIFQAASVFDGPRLIGGDLNTNDLLWVGNVFPVPFVQAHTKAVQRAMTTNGYSTPFESTGATFDYLGLRLDWIFLNELNWLDAGMEDIRFSDHRAIWARIQAQ